MVASLESSIAKSDSRALRSALGRFATGVCIVTTRNAANEPIGMTVNSFASVSLEPPLILFGVARTCYSNADWLAAEHYAVNVLSASQRPLSTRFAKELSEKWAGLSPERGLADLPLLPNALARFQCRSEHRYKGGDHVILVGRVLAFDTPRGGEPLVFFEGRYRELADARGVGSAHDPLWLLGW
jgi:flavin reductase (DIM6/NTAB) family NADH-FMN oxidoreductase RutF